MSNKVIKDPALQDLLTAEEIQKRIYEQRALKNQIDEARAVNEKGESYWVEVKRKADDLRDKEFAGYNDWAIGMMNIVHAAKILNKAMLHQPNLLPFANERAEIWDKLKAVVWIGVDKLQSSAKDTKVGQKIKDTFIGEAIFRKTVDLPKIEFTVNIKNNGQIESTAAIDGKVLPSGDRILRHLDIGLGVWAGTHGYSIDQSDNNKLKNSNTGEVMTPEKFEDLKNDPDKGLNAFLSGHFDMNLTYRPPSLTTAPSP
jgi:hypothetical protein